MGSCVLLCSTEGKMKRPTLALLVVLAGITTAFADVCPSSTLDKYLGSGFSCGIDDKTFFDFNYASSSNPGGFAIPAAGVSVTPLTQQGNPGFLFNAPWTVSNNSGVIMEDSLIGYTVTVNSGGAPITDLTLAMVGFDAIGTGEITIDETYCLGGILPVCSGGTEGTLSLNYTSKGGATSQTVNFAGVTEVSVEKDILLTAGTNGQAAVSGVYNQFSEGGTTPEPASIVLFGTGVLGLAGVMRRKLRL
jgi:PEP-CTERM motif